MVDLAMLQVVRDFVAIFGVIAGLTYYVLTVRNQDKSRKAQLLMGLYEAYRSPEFRNQLSEILSQEWDDFDDFWEKYGIDTNPEAWVKWVSVVSYFHGIGVLLRQELIDIDLVEELLVNIILISWVRMGPIVKGFRENVARTRSSRYDPYSGFEYLYSEIKRREQQHPELRT